MLDQFDEEIYPQLRDNASPLLRLPVDRISDRSTLVYNFMTDHLLNFIRRKPSMETRRSILRTTIQAIADLHSRDIVHLGINLESFVEELS